MIIVLGLLLLLLIPLCIKISYRRENKNDRLQAAFSFLGGMLPVKVNIPVSRLRKKELEIEAEVGDNDRPMWEQKKGMPLNFSIGVIKQIQPLLNPGKKFFFRYSRWQELQLEAVYGNESAAVTGLTYGFLSGIFINLQRFLQENLTFKSGTKPKLTIVPDFNDERLFLRADLNFSIRIWAILFLGLKTLLLIRKGRKNNGRSSDSGADGNSNGKSEGNG